LDADKFDYGQARSMRVVGSSETNKENDGKIHWKGAEKTANFKPLTRWHAWSRAKHERFNWKAGKYLSLLDYTPKKYESNSILYAVWNVFLDVKWRIMNYKDYIKQS